MISAVPGWQGKSDVDPRSKACVKLLLFDIDGTLVHSGGAGKRAMERAFEKVWGIPDAFQGISLMGRTDTSILHEALGKQNLDRNGPQEERFRELYFLSLAEEMEVPNPQKRLCPGVRSLLAELKKSPGIFLGLLTGNWRTGAFLKLRWFGIEGYFPFGAFADDSGNRNDLVPIALKRFRKTSGSDIRKEDVYVIGDTPLDIHCARPHGVRTVAVATGLHSLDDLAGEKPDHLFRDFSDTNGILKLFI